MATFLKISEKEGRIDHQYLLYGTMIVKIGPADLEILWLGANKSGTTENCLPCQRPLTNRNNWTWSRKFTKIPSIRRKDRENRSCRYWDSFAHSKKTRNAWQSLAYSPLGAVVLPLANTCEKHLAYWLPECLTAHPIANVGELSVVTRIDSGRTTSFA